MDQEWAEEQLSRMIGLTQRVPLGLFRLEYRGTEEQIAAQAAMTERILDRVLPRWRRETPAGARTDPWGQHREASIRALTILKRSDEMEQHLEGPAPWLEASSFHEWVWDAARALWIDGHYREAVLAAAVRVSAELQRKTDRRDISETTLFQHAFSNDPPRAGSVRLRPRGDDDGKTAMSVRRGFVALAEGAYAAIRNPIGHDEGSLSEQEALEYLSVFSILARAVDTASVLR